jgi:hypothetical protein
VKVRRVPDTQAVSHEGPGHKYYHQMLNMADDDLRHHEYRVYGRYCRLAGDGLRPVYESSQRTADICGMSKRKLIEVRNWLNDHGWIRLKYDTAKAVGSQSVQVIVLDRWRENVERYESAYAGGADVQEVQTGYVRPAYAVAPGADGYAPDGIQKKEDEEPLKKEGDIYKLTLVQRSDAPMPDLPAYQCPRCGDPFADSPALVAHVETHRRSA